MLGERSRPGPDPLGDETDLCLRLGICIGHCSARPSCAHAGPSRIRCQRTVPPVVHMERRLKGWDGKGGGTRTRDCWACASGLKNGARAGRGRTVHCPRRRRAVGGAAGGAVGRLRE